MYMLHNKHGQFWLGAGNTSLAKGLVNFASPVCVVSQQWTSNTSNSMLTVVSCDVFLIGLFGKSILCMYATIV